MDEYPDWQPTITRGLELLTVSEIFAVLVLVFAPTHITVPVIGWGVVSVVEVFALSYEIPSAAYATTVWLSATPSIRYTARRRIVHSIIMVPTVLLIHFVMH